MICVSALSMAYSIFVFLPGLAVSVRRLHDTGHSGAHYFLILIPLVGPFILLFYFCRDSDPEKNQYGPSPKHMGISSNDTGIHNNYSDDSQAVGTDLSDNYSNTAVTEKKIRVSCLAGPYAGMSAEGDTIYIGRDIQRCLMALPNTPGVSKVHCLLRTDGQMIELRDLHSSYGTFLSDGTRLETDKPLFVQNGTTIYLGSKDVAVSIRFV
jgi:hypothetical protein